MKCHALGLTFPACSCYFALLSQTDIAWEFAKALFSRACEI